MTLLVLSGIISVTRRQSEAEVHVFDQWAQEIIFGTENSPSP